MKEKERELLIDFLDQFVQPVEHNRKYSSTTMHSIYKSLQRIFSKFGDIDLKWDDVCDVFEKKGYRFTDAKMRYVEDIKAHYVSPNGEYFATAGVMERGDHTKTSPYFYVNISPVRLNELKKTTKKMPPNVSNEKLKKWCLDTREMEGFFS
ncbi:hypothetical protein [Roseivirga pacifica]|uniref:hypothetical protein n=1 Tax=Roseivirga pacifica TaxID=1267423 RepID=UPI003BAA2F3E